MAHPAMSFTDFIASLNPEDFGPAKPGRKSNCPEKEELEKAYVEERVRVTKIAEYYGVKPITVYKWLSKYGITGGNENE